MLVSKIAGKIKIDKEETIQMSRKLSKAMPDISYGEYIARQYFRLIFAAFFFAVFKALNLDVLAFMFLLVFILDYFGQKERLDKLTKEKDEAISAEMPGFVRSICRALQGNRDVYAVIESYRKAAGKELGGELDILLASMKSGSVEGALWEFKNRIGTDDAARLCSILAECEKGIDQSAALEYLARDMSVRQRLDKEKALDERPGKLKKTYIPAVGIAVMTVMYVLILFVMGQVNNLY